MNNENQAPPTKDENPRESKDLVRGVGITAICLLAVIVYFLNKSDGGFLLLLEETAVARGLITFLVAIITLCIALLIAIWVVASFAKPDDLKARFAYLKDVLATLVGILYFGSAEKSTAPSLAVSEIQFRVGQMVVHASGGTPPYRYTVTPGEQDAKYPKLSRDGWIFETLPAAATPGTVVTVEVVDAKDKRDFRTGKVAAQPQVNSPSSAPR